jgi:hypothetical protein
MRLPDGKELLVTLKLPLPLALVGDLAMAIGEAAGIHGYTDVLLTDDMWHIVGTPPEAKADRT